MEKPNYEKVDILLNGRTFSKGSTDDILTRYSELTTANSLLKEITIYNINFKIIKFTFDSIIIYVDYTKLTGLGDGNELLNTLYKSDLYNTILGFIVKEDSISSVYIIFYTETEKKIYTLDTLYSVFNPLFKNMLVEKIKPVYDKNEKFKLMNPHWKLLHKTDTYDKYSSTSKVLDYHGIIKDKNNKNYPLFCFPCSLPTSPQPYATNFIGIYFNDTKTIEILGLGNSLLDKIRYLKSTGKNYIVDTFIEIIFFIKSYKISEYTYKNSISYIIFILRDENDSEKSLLLTKNKKPKDHEIPKDKLKSETFLYPNISEYKSKQNFTHDDIKLKPNTFPSDIETSIQGVHFIIFNKVKTKILLSADFRSANQTKKTVSFSTPGGAVEFGKTFIDAGLDELEEELQMKLVKKSEPEVGKIINIRDAYKEGIIKMFFYDLNNNQSRDGTIISDTHMDIYISIDDEEYTINFRYGDEMIAAGFFDLTSDPPKPFLENFTYNQSFLETTFPGVDIDTILSYFKMFDRGFTKNLTIDRMNTEIKPILANIEQNDSYKLSLTEMIPKVQEGNLEYNKVIHSSIYGTYYTINPNEIIMQLQKYNETNVKLMIDGIMRSSIDHHNPPLSSLYTRELDKKLKEMGLSEDDDDDPYNYNQDFLMRKQARKDVKKAIQENIDGGKKIRYTKRKKNNYKIRIKKKKNSYKKKRISKKRKSKKYKKSKKIKRSTKKNKPNKTI